MKLYLIAYLDRDNGNCQEWVGTQADSKRRYKELCAEYERFNVDKPLLVEVPTAKPALLAWLNQNCNTNNG
jgi:hypothetical protein